MRDGLSGVTSHSSWVKPRDGVVRVNTNDALLGDDGVGLGVVIRDSGGMVCAVAIRRVQARWPAALAEAMAAKIGLIIACGLGYVSVELKVDASNLVKALYVRSFGRAPIDLDLRRY